MKLRRILFWIHLTVGLLAGAVVLVMSATGVLLAYKQQILRSAGRQYRVADPQRLPLGDLLAKVRASQGAMPSGITLRQEHGAPVELSFGRDRIVLVNSATGEVLGESRKLPAFFATVEDIHRWLGARGEKREVGRAVTGACNLAFLVLVATGPFLWWPKEWSWSNLKKIVLFRRGLGGRALFWNWHNVLGIWCVVPLFFVVVTGVVMSYSWANNLLYQLTGNEPPQQSAPVNRPGAANRGPSDVPDPAALEKLVVTAGQQVPQWRSMTVRLGGRGPQSVIVDEGNSGRPDLRSQFTLDGKSGEVRHETFSSYSSGRRLRTWARFTHTGEAGGWWGQTIAAVASAGAVMLGVSGMILSGKRFIAWRARG